MLGVIIIWSDHEKHRKIWIVAESIVKLPNSLQFISCYHQINLFFIRKVLIVLKNAAYATICLHAASRSFNYKD